MKPVVISKDQAALDALAAMGLGDITIDITSEEAVCVALRRAASFLCPATPRVLVDAVLDAASLLDEDGALTRDRLMECLDLLLGVGDLIELRTDEGRSRRLIFLGPPSFVRRDPGRYLLLGVRPFAAALVDDTLAPLVRYDRHLRTVSWPDETAVEEFATAGLREIARNQWLRLPKQVSAGAHLAEARGRLDAEMASGSGQVSGLQVIDTTARVDYYRGRWRALQATDTGYFVGRRPQEYGADLWCLVSVSYGRTIVLVDFPLSDPITPAHDEAWRLQTALDAERGVPQVARLRPDEADAGAVVLDLFAPVPTWAQRAIELSGEPLPRSKRALFSFRLPAASIPGVTAVLADLLWMKILEGGDRG